MGRFPLKLFLTPMGLGPTSKLSHYPDPVTIRMEDWDSGDVNQLHLNPLFVEGMMGADPTALLMVPGSPSSSPGALSYLLGLSPISLSPYSLHTSPVPKHQDTQGTSSGSPTAGMGADQAPPKLLILPNYRFSARRTPGRRTHESHSSLA